jgi:hypothetical protein
MIRTVKKKIKGHDLFGYDVSLYFNGNPGIYKTLCGGILSLCVVKVLLMVYFIILVKKLLLYEDDTYSAVVWAVDPLEAGQIPVNETVQVVFALEKADENFPIKYDEEARKHIRIYATNMAWNNYKENRELTGEDTKVEMRPCTDKDFNKTYAISREFQEMKRQNLQLICPETTSGLFIQNFTHHGSGLTFRLSIDKCSGSGCKDSNLVKEYIDNLNILTYAVHNQVQYDLHDQHPPIVETFMLLDRFNLNPDKLRDNSI